MYNLVWQRKAPLVVFLCFFFIVFRLVWCECVYFVVVFYFDFFSRFSLCQRHILVVRSQRHANLTYTATHSVHILTKVKCEYLFECCELKANSVCVYRDELQKSPRYHEILKGTARRQIYIHRHNIQTQHF